MLLEKLAKIAGRIAEVSRVYPEQAKVRLRIALSHAGMAASTGEWLALATVAPFPLSFLAAFAALLQTGDIALALAAALLAFAASFALLWREPFARAGRRARSVEAELPFALRALAVELNSRAPFERALRNASRGYGELGKELRRVVGDIDCGAGVCEALKALGERVESLQVKQAVVQLSLAYEQGSGGEGLRKLAEELSLAQRAAVREYHAKLALTGLLFISIACVVPALFAAYVIVGSAFMDLSFSPSDVYVAYLLAFPALDLAALWFAHSSKPLVVGA